LVEASIVRNSSIDCLLVLKIAIARDFYKIFTSQLPWIFICILNALFLACVTRSLIQLPLMRSLKITLQLSRRLIVPDRVIDIAKSTCLLVSLSVIILAIELRSNVVNLLEQLNFFHFIF
jgi:hypothetical protein